MKRFFFFNIGAWVLVVSLSFFWNFKNTKQQQADIALQSARSFFNLIVITREWNARHNGVYVPVTATTQPNPYLEDTDRDIKIDQNQMLTKINPAFMTREISELSSQYQGVQFHLTSLMPLNPHNVATEREKEALQSFQDGKNESGYFIRSKQEPSFFYMAPLITTQACLHCHAQQGYKIGDVRGGISVTLPSLSEMSIGPLLIAHCLIGILGIAGIVFFGIRLNDAYNIVKRHAAIDALTGIPNRRSFSRRFLEEFQRSRRKGEPLSVLFCDIDNFKGYNDTYGHNAGDVCLHRTAQAIRKSLERPGDFCARYGGEEFVVILPDTNSAGALSIAERLLKNVRDLQMSHKHSPPSYFITLSIGTATTDRNARSLSHEELIKQADTALYVAKKNGKNCAVQYTIDVSL
jgi:diguanylate cyclase (GGDEF)-like protein